MNLIQRMSRLIVAMSLIVGPTGPVYARSASAPALPNKGIPTSQSAQAQARSSFMNLPLYFEANQGQTDRSVKFFTRAGGYNLYLTASEAVMVLPATKAKASAVVRMKLKGANANPVIRGLQLQPGRTNYLVGKNPARMPVGVKHYAKVMLSQVYPGIDMVYYGNKGQIEYDFIVAPGANPGRILVGFEGGKGLRLGPQGDLILAVEGGEVTYKAPALYQQKAGAKRTHVNGRYVLAGKNQVRFEVGDYIRTRELVIDPALAYSTFLGGAVDDRAYAIAVNAANEAYVTGSVISANFPSIGGPVQPATGGGTDAFVTKINALGTAVVWSTYYGAAGDDIGLGIALDGTARAYVTGSTTGGLPATIPAPTLLGPGGGTDAFLVAFNPAGTAVIYAVRYGGPQVESGNGIAVDSAGNAYVTGVTGSIATNSFPVITSFPSTPLAAQPNAVAGAQTDAYVAKFNAVGAQVYASYLGGTGIDRGNGIAIDTPGNAYITGQAGDAFIAVVDYPSVFKNTVTGANDAFIVKMDPTGANFVYKTYVGGSGIDEGTDIALDNLNKIYITGYTFSADFPKIGFATVGQTTIGTAPDAFVFKLNVDGGGGNNDGVYATYLGGSGDDRATGIAVDDAGLAYVTGITFAGDFPRVDPIVGGGSLVGAPEAFVTQFGPTGATIGFSTYLGGTVMSGAQGIALDTLKNIYVVGWSNSTAATFPQSAPVARTQPDNAGSFDAFAVKFGAAVAVPAAVCTITGVIPASGFTLGGTTVTISGTGFANFLNPNGVTFDNISASTYTANASSTVIVAVTPVHLVAGNVPLTVRTAAGTCSSVYSYVVAPLVGAGCGDDYFFPSPATGAIGQFAYCMELSGRARIRIYNTIGDLVATLDDTRPAGAALSSLNTARLAPGVYLYFVEKDYGGGNIIHAAVKKFVVRH